MRLRQLRWGDEKQIAAAGTHDLILGSDILYHTGSYPALADTLAGLARPGTVALLATPDEAFALKLFDILLAKASSSTCINVCGRHLTCEGRLIRRRWCTWLRRFTCHT